jgi:Mn2+/Fe2+ NRAMP family transporter
MMFTPIPVVALLLGIEAVEIAVLKSLLGEIAAISGIFASVPVIYRVGACVDCRGISGQRRGSGERGRQHRVPKARAFYTAVSLATLAGCALNFTAVNPIRALYWSAVLNGVVAAPVMAAMMHMSSRRTVVGNWTLPRGLRLLGWGATCVMGLTVLAFVATALRRG